MRKRQLCVVLFATFTADCGRDVPRRPQNVPVSAVWVGGKDGGVFISCSFSHSSEPNACTIYSDTTGQIEMDGQFTSRKASIGVPLDARAFRSFDGSRIYLRNGTILERTRAVPPTVPKDARLSENGLYVVCYSLRAKDYQCTIYYSSTGRELSRGVYQPSGAQADSCSVEHGVKLASAPVIETNGGCQLTRMQDLK
jgi:hypothetical protein